MTISILNAKDSNKAWLTSETRFRVCIQEGLESWGSPQSVRCNLAQHRGPHDKSSAWFVG